MAENQESEFYQAVIKNCQMQAQANTQKCEETLEKYRMHIHSLYQGFKFLSDYYLDQYQFEADQLNEMPDWCWAESMSNEKTLVKSQVFETAANAVACEFPWVKMENEDERK
jgi:hypothetical protein